MKKTLSLIIVSSLILVSCKTIKKVNCEAYSDNENVEFDIEKINQKNASKYITTYTIK